MSVFLNLETSFIRHTFDFRWKINLNPQFRSDNFKAKSPEFHPAKNLSFYATVDIKMSNIVREVRISEFNISFLQSSGYDIGTEHNLSITDSTGQELYEIHRNPNSFSAWNPFIIKNISLQFSPAVLILKNKMVFQLPSTDVEPINLQLGEMVKLPSLVDDLKTMYDNSLHADLIIEVDDSTVRAHKSILSARSPVFAQMFESSMDENDKNFIKIVDLKLPVLKGFLEFLYTQFLPEEDFEYVCDMYYAADKYFVHTLRKKCKDVLLTKMDARNACRVLSLADRHADDQFKDSVMEFIRNHFDDIQETDSWEEFLFGETVLAAEVMRSCSRKKNM